MYVIFTGAGYWMPIAENIYYGVIFQKYLMFVHFVPGLIEGKFVPLSIVVYLDRLNVIRHVQIGAPPLTLFLPFIWSVAGKVPHFFQL